jgi:O-antigen ligase
VVAFVPYLLWAALSLAWTPSRQLVYDALQLLATVDLWMLIAGAMILAHKRTRMMRFLTLTAVLALIVAGMGLYVYFVYGSFKYAGWDVGRVYNEWGRAVANGAIVLLVLFLRSRFASARQLFLGGLLGLCALFIFIASSRSALLILAVPTMLFMAVNLAPFGQRGLALSRAQLLLLMVVAAVVTLVTVLISSGVQIDTVNRLLKVFVQAENTDMILGANRFDYFAAAMDYIAQSPLIGHGVRSFTVLYRGFELEGVQPHNIFLELLSDTGLIGFAAFGILLFMALRPLTLRRLRTDPLLLCVAMLFTGRMTAAMFGQDLSFQNMLFLTIGLLALRPVPADTTGEEEPVTADELEEADGMWQERDIRPGHA